MTARRALGVIRLSVGGRNQTGEATQKKKITARCIADEVELVDFATDVDVSASYSPWDRPELGKWLNDHKDEFDVLYVLKMDRIIRSNRDLVDLLDWLDANGKSLVSVEEGFDFSTALGRMVAKLLSVVAEAELDAIKARIRASRETMRAKGRWPGGVVPFGRIAVSEGEDQGYTLKICPTYGPWLIKIIEKFRDIKSFTAVAAWLNAEKVPTAFDVARIRAKEAKSNTRLSGAKLAVRGSKWTATQVQSLLSSRNLLGEYTRADKSVARNPDGTPIMRSTPVLAPEEFEELQTTIRAVKFTKSPQRPSPYLGVLNCGCARPLYYVKPRGGRQDRFRCQGLTKDNIKPCENSNFTGDAIRAEVKSAFMRVLGDKPVMEKTVSMDDSAVIKIAVLEAQLDQYMAELKNGAITATEFAEYSAKTAQERENLTNQPAGKARVEFTPTGQTYREWWESTDESTRREKLCLWGIKAVRDQEGMTLHVGTELFERLQHSSEPMHEPIIQTYRVEHAPRSH